MSRAEADACALLAAVAAACALPGALLVLRRLSLVGDAIAHTLLFGIVASYAVVRDLESPWLFVGAGLGGVLTVALVDLLSRARLVKEDAAIGLVFPALFSLGALGASMLFRDTHLDVDSVMLGHAELASQARPVTLLGSYLGRAPTVGMAALFASLAVVTALAYKELKLTTFDPALAASLGFVPVAVHYGLMAAVSATTVLALDAAGPVLVVAFLVVPASAARLLTDRLGLVLVLSVAIGVAGAVAGTRLAFAAGGNVAGTAAATLGLMYAVAFVAAPGRGALAEWARRRGERAAFRAGLVRARLDRGPATPGQLAADLGWTLTEVERAAGAAARAGTVARVGGEWHPAGAG